MTMTTKHSVEELIGALEHYPWWSGARMQLLRQGGCDTKDSITHLHATLRPLATIELKGVDIERLTHLSTEDLIERFLKRDDYRIVAEEGAAEDLAQREIDDNGDMVSEELAEIYLNQGLYDAAIDTYRKLSLLNSEKSIYFAGLIAKIEEKRRSK